MLISLHVLITFTICSHTATESEDKLKEKINISEGNMKHKKLNLKYKISNAMSSAETQQPPAENSAPSAPIYDKVNSNDDVGKNTNLMSFGGNAQQTNKDEINLGDGPIF
jgi:hypothetical protein